MDFSSDDNNNAFLPFQSPKNILSQQNANLIHNEFIHPITENIEIIPSQINDLQYFSNSILLIFKDLCNLDTFDLNKIIIILSKKDNLNIYSTKQEYPYSRLIYISILIIIFFIFLFPLF